MKIYPAIPVFFILFSLACGRKGDNSIITYSVKHSDYSERLSVNGTVQAVVNTPVMPPSGENFWGAITVKWIIDDGTFVKKGDTICLLSFPELESWYNDALTRNDSLRAALNRAVADSTLKVALLEAQLATSEADLKISSLDSLKLKFAPPVQRRLLELGMQKTLIEKARTEKKLKATRSISEAGIKQIKSTITQSKSRTESLLEQVNALTLTASRDGLVMRVVSPRFMIAGPAGTGSIGGQIKVGSTIFMDNPVLQFPDMSKMQVSAEVAEADFRKILPGQKAYLTIGSANNLETTGKVNRKSLISRMNQMYSDVNVKFYEVIIDIDSCHERMKPGLSASCEIVISEASDTISIPTLAIFERDSSKVVYVLQGKSYLPVRVETGQTGSNFTIISEGLKGNETIALSAPPERLVAEAAVMQVSTDTTRLRNRVYNKSK
jgi:multidrug efflux pump subunit AcrA (membrane-fusion protein)